MDTDRLHSMLVATLEDGRLSRAERKAFATVLREDVDSAATLDVTRRLAFELARSHLAARADRRLVDWLEDIVRAVDAARAAPRPDDLAEVWFSPGRGCGRRVAGLLDGARSTLEVCVFTITDDRISRSLLAAHRRGIQVRVISDDDKAMDRGSDLPALAEAGVPVAVDDSAGHMHHKFALVDRRIVLTGSYNWTRSAAEQNHENLVISDHPGLVQRFTAEFERMWARYHG
jgi:phosphatidylserine/phosphatidylglycerophosphate/cardiolipin synthase-like enzyme